MLFACLYAATLTGKSPAAAIGEGALAAAYLYLLVHGVMLLLYPLGRSIRAAWRKSLTRKAPES